MMATAKPWAGVIVRKSGIQGGEPTIRGTRVPVRSIVIAFEEHAGELDRVAKAFSISHDDARAAMAFYAAHKSEIDEIIARQERAAYQA